MRVSSALCADANAHLLLRGGEVCRCQRTGLGEMHLPFLAHGQYPVDRGAMEADS